MKILTRFFALLVAVIACASVCVACNLEKSTDPKYFAFTLNADLNGYTVSASAEEMPLTVIIPAEYNGLPVLAVKENGFSGENCSGIKEVVIKGAEVSVGNNAFRNLPNLRYIEFRYAASVSVGTFAFENCPELKELKLSEKANTFFADSFAFKSTGFTDVYIAAQSVILKDYSFASCASLKSFKIKAASHDVAQNAADKCDNLSVIEYVNS